jgi:myo-inositol-1(or 4)-monophosphatase
MMSEGLSVRGSELLKLCDGAADRVASAVRDMVGTASAGQKVNMGADGTPTKRIDRAAENAVLEALSASGLRFRVLSEEIGEVSIGGRCGMDDAALPGRKKAGERPDYFLHLDPLDGTFNALSGIPFYSVSIFLSGRETSFAYVRDLASGGRYYAEAGRGAYCGQGERMAVSDGRDLSSFSISAYTLRPHTGRLAGIGDTVRRIRTLGSASLEMALVACGRLDAFVDLRGMMRVVDVAAGKLLIEEAGGTVTDASGSSLQLGREMWQRKDLIGSNGLRHAELLRLIGGGAD